ncbi:MAG: type I methionyl aminopeptidase [Elusimicrobia bacterium]|nr:type I methionyl aminopeptidase [Elusimicrobiota bacterium]
MLDLKTDREIDIMHDCGQKLSEIARELKEMIRPGINTAEIDIKARKLFKKNKLRPAFLNYGSPPFPATICTSINEEVVHGIPSPGRVLEEGDIISVDIGGVWKGFFTDMAFTAGVGSISEEKKRLLSVTRKALESGTEKMCEEFKLFDVSWTIQQVAENAGYSVVRELVGHGIGRKLHESPQVPNYGRKGTGIKLEKGLVLAIEPMLNMGTHRIKVKDDKWTIETEDGKCSCHFENTVAVTSGGPRILTGI